jgi:hypothetical protein
MYLSGKGARAVSGHPLWLSFVEGEDASDTVTDFAQTFLSVST